MWRRTTGPSMPRLPEPPKADSFFARVEAARLECPRCGYLDRFSTKGPVKGKVGDPDRTKRKLGKGRSPAGWNPLTSRWQCPSCRLTFVLGLLAWPVERGPAAATLPRDQVPSVRQLAQLRAQGGGLWMRDAVKGWRATGSNVCAGCTCQPGCHYTDAADPACPLLDHEG